MHLLYLFATPIPRWLECVMQIYTDNADTGQYGYKSVALINTNTINFRRSD